MKIIDCEKKGNVVRFYLGADDCENYWGDDWNDAPYERNAGTVYSQFVTGIRDVAFPFDALVLEPCDGIYNTRFSRENMKNRIVPCLIVIPPEFCKNSYRDDYAFWAGHKAAKAYYFGDPMEPADDVTVMSFPW